jgi:EAL domain-containing protein (putative c-di-GMP-specific phosphodiesterase class I)
MIELSVERCRQYHDQGIPISISLNLAPETLANPNFIRQVSSCMKRHGVHARLPDPSRSRNRRS